MIVVKKYANRRLYDTVRSRYITLEDLAALIRSGEDVLVQDAHSGADLTQAALTHIILEMRSGAKLLPVPLLMRLIRLGDESLAEFFGRHVSWALELYVQAKQGAPMLLPLNPLATAPFAATDALAPPAPAPSAPPSKPISEPVPMSTADSVAVLRAELESLKRELLGAARAAQGRPRRAAARKATKKKR